MIKEIPKEVLYKPLSEPQCWYRDLVSEYKALQKRHAELVELVENWKEAKINNERWRHTFGLMPELCDIEASRGNEFYKKFKEAESALRDYGRDK